MENKLFVTGIGTDVGKSWATGWLANYLRKRGLNVITQKFIQTGNNGLSEDIEVHRRIMGIPVQDVDHRRLTCPQIFTYPASPHLAAKIDGHPVDLAAIDAATEQLEKMFDVVLIEGAGGVMVPVNEDYLTIDYIESRNLPAVVVTNGQLGSISDTLLTLEALDRRGVKIWGVIYNPHFDTDKVIADDAREFMKNRVEKFYPESKWMEM